MGVLDWLYSLGYEAAYGTPSPSRRAEIGNEAALGVRRAGGSAVQAQGAVDEVNSYLDDYWPSRTPAGTLWDVATGDPMGRRRASDADSSSTSDWTWAILLLIVALILVALIVSLFD